MWDNFDIGEIMEKAKARKLVGKPSMSQVLYQEALGEYEVPRAKKKSVVRSERAVTMGSFVDGLRGIASPALAKLLEHVALTAFVLSAGASPSGMGSSCYRALGVRLPAQAAMLWNVVINLG